MSTNIQLILLYHQIFFVKKLLRKFPVIRDRDFVWHHRLCNTDAKQNRSCEGSTGEYA
jgi:hypothetical protein